MAITQIKKEQIASVDVDSLDCSSNLKTFLNSASSANLAAAVTGTTGSGDLVFATSPALTTPDLGTPSAGTLTSCTGLPISTGVSGLATGVATFLATPSSANLISAVTDETGTGALVFANSPTLVTPALGTPASGVLDNCTTADTPSGGSSVVNKNYVDSIAAGLSWKESVKAATTGNITLSAAQTIDNISIVAGDRVLVKNQSTASENGIYICDSSAWSRAEDMDESDEFSGSAVFVQQGDSNGDQGYVCTNNGSVTVDSTDVSFTQFTGTGAFNFRTGLTASGNSVDVAFRSEVFIGSEFSDDASFNTDYAVSYIEADSGGGNHFAGMEAPAAGEDNDAGRNNFPFNVYLNGILLSNIKLATSSSVQTIEDFLAGTDVSENNGENLQLDSVALISDTRSGFKLYFNQADIADGDIITLVYAL